MKPVGDNLKPKTTVRVTYGPTKRSLALITPPMAADWPMLGPDGNMGSKFGPDAPDKAVYVVGLADRALEGVDQHRVAHLFTVLNLIDERVSDFVYAHQKDVLGTRDLSPEAVRGKMSAAVKQRYDGDTPLYKRMNVSVRCLDYNGNRRALPQLDCNRQPLAEGHEIKHEDLLMAAIQLDMFYSMTNVFGVKWAPVQLMLLRRRADQAPPTPADIWANVGVPQWATADPPPAPPLPGSNAYAGMHVDGQHHFESSGFN
mmetsp:Transcript_29643/g.74589  ORF Transcript_29643/g.74589 Transcript_29643/m.74589 type:complete len:258 (-) Transcript_29643:56-829(-)